jgi:hypothetical protein
MPGGRRGNGVWPTTETGPPVTLLRRANYLKGLADDRPHVAAKGSATRGDI